MGEMLQVNSMAVKDLRTWRAVFDVYWYCQPSYTGKMYKAWEPVLRGREAIPGSWVTRNGFPFRYIKSMRTATA